MTDGDDRQYRRPRAILCLVVALFSATVFLLHVEPPYVRGVVVSLVLGVWGVGDLLQPQIARWLDSATARTTGLFWVAVGVGLGTGSVLASTIINKLGWGVLLGAGVVVYGMFVAVTD
ncbi:hypothetical protein SAMN04487950_1145 [Halogranum rubrum]|uniref:Uncharacterized protein n=1 Tax=Halogranum rubrum TaxID=553466 RepID=A0A1I4CIU0_9EURY|nr:hypothetical protein [Halogranum rubrum]SFK79871.1 hypothetical protein SAMN04487950_1145 [Halogranum rubrum]